MWDMEQRNNEKMPGLDLLQLKLTYSFPKMDDQNSKNAVDLN